MDAIISTNKCENCGSAAVRQLGPCLIRCRTCGFLGVDRNERDRQQAIFFEPAPASESKVRELLAKYPRDGHGKQELYARWAKRLLKVISGENAHLKALDVGASGGAFLHEFEKLGVSTDRLELLEANPNYVEYTNRLYGYRSLLDNIEQFDAPPASYGLITMLDVLEHVDKVDVALANIRRILDTGGYLLLKLPNGRWAMGKYRVARWLGQRRRIGRLLYLEPGGHLNYWSPRNVRNLERSGLRLVESGAVSPTRRQFGSSYWWRAGLYRLDRMAGSDLFPEFYALFQKV